MSFEIACFLIAGGAWVASKALPKHQRPDIVLVPQVCAPLPQPKPEPRQPTISEAAIARITAKTEAIMKLRRIQEQHPELLNDPQIGMKIKGLFYAEEVQILTGRDH